MDAIGTKTPAFNIRKNTVISSQAIGTQLRFNIPYMALPKGTIQALQSSPVQRTSLSSSSSTLQQVQPHTVMEQLAFSPASFSGNHIMIKPVQMQSSPNQAADGSTASSSTTATPPGTIISIPEDTWSNIKNAKKVISTVEGVYNEVITQGYTQKIPTHERFKIFSAVFDIVKEVVQTSNLIRQFDEIERCNNNPILHQSDEDRQRGQEIINDARSSAYTAYFLNALIGYTPKIAELSPIQQSVFLPLTAYAGRVFGDAIKSDLEGARRAVSCPNVVAFQIAITHDYNLRGGDVSHADMNVEGYFSFNITKGAKIVLNEEDSDYTAMITITILKIPSLITNAYINTALYIIEETFC
jgi:hypothetical protein